MLKWSTMVTKYTRVNFAYSYGDPINMATALSPKYKDLVEYLTCPQMEGGEHKTLNDKEWRRSCGCIKTSDKLRQILMTFPSVPPPSPNSMRNPKMFLGQEPYAGVVTCISSCCTKHDGHRTWESPPMSPCLTIPVETQYEPKHIHLVKKKTSSWQVIAGLVSLIQLSVTATALALYYVIYCYMQLVYYTLRSALYFHNADGPMKITIGVMTITSIIVGLNILIRIERFAGIECLK